MGTMGTTGTTGATGPLGPVGVTGATGATGLPGTSSSPGATGATGAPGSTGATGAPGVTGTTGATGAPGAPGAAATPVTAQAGLVGFGAIYGMTVDPGGSLWVAYDPAFNYDEDEARTRHKPLTRHRNLEPASSDSIDIAEYLAGTVTTAAGYASPAPNYGAILSTNRENLQGFAVDGSGDVFLGQANQIEAFSAPASSTQTPATIPNQFPGNYYYVGQEFGLSKGTLYALDIPTPAPSGTPATPVIAPYTFTGGALVAGPPIVPSSFATFNPDTLVADYAGVLTNESNTGYGFPPDLSIYSQPATGAPDTSNLLAEATGPYDSVARDPATGDVYFLSQFNNHPTVLVYAPSGTKALASLAFFVLPGFGVTLTADVNFLYIALLNGTISAYPKYNPAAPYDARTGRAFNPWRPYSKAAYEKIRAR